MHFIGFHFVLPNHLAGPTRSIGPRKYYTILMISGTAMLVSARHRMTPMKSR